MTTIKIYIFLLPIVLNIFSSFCVVINDPYDTARRLQADYNLYDILSSKQGRQPTPSALQNLLRLIEINEAAFPPQPSDEQNDLEYLRDVLGEINDSYTSKNNRMSSITKRKVFWQPLGYVPAALRKAGNKGQSSGSSGSSQTSNILRYG